MHEPARQRARDLASTPAFANAQRQRKKVEALFAELKNQIGLRRLRLRRMKFVREQFFLAAAAQNIKRRHQRGCARCEPPRRNHAGGWGLLRDGSGLHRFSTALRLYAQFGLLWSNVLLERRYSHPVDKSTGVRSDQTVILSSFASASAYPDPLRKVSYYDAETNKRLKFLTDNFTLSARTIAQIYKQRWQVELFFKWIKQHLRIKAFYGTSENAVKTQIWIAVSMYVLVAIMRKRLGLEGSLYQILQILSVTLFEKTPILRALRASRLLQRLTRSRQPIDSVRHLTGQQ
jgi:Transposase DDE domain